MQADFENLTPDVVLEAVEVALRISLTGLTQPLTSYINRVYELEATDGTRLIAKFYRPERWSPRALQDEHDFILECVDAEIPVIPPMELPGGHTLGAIDGICFAVFPKRFSRHFEIIHDDDWRRLGRILGRLHMIGSDHAAEDRVTLHPQMSTVNDIHQLHAGEFVAPHLEEEFQATGQQILDLVTPLFDDREQIRIHGDCHAANILNDPDDGLMLIDFDDMAMGPPAQDFWMLLPEHARQSRREIDLILDGYEDFREFDYFSLKLIEPLRAMRSLYFLAWCSRQINDPAFQNNFPDWGNHNFWQSEITALQRQLTIIKDHLE